MPRNPQKISKYTISTVMTKNKKRENLVRQKKPALTSLLTMRVAYFYQIDSMLKYYAFLTTSEIE